LELAAVTTLAEAETAGVLKWHPAFVSRIRLLLDSPVDGQYLLLSLQHHSCMTLLRFPMPFGECPTHLSEAHHRQD
jgi:hypothetical protein